MIIQIKNRTSLQMDHEDFGTRHESIFSLDIYIKLYIQGILQINEF